MVLIKRTIPLTVEDHPDLRAAVGAFGAVRRAISGRAFNGGKPLGAIALQNVVYREAVKTLSAQMACSAIRSVAAAYAAAKSNKRPAKSPFTFTRDAAVFLIGKRGRDASFKADGTLSIWTPNGRKRLTFRVPKAFRKDFDGAVTRDSLTVFKDGDRLKASLCVTLEVPDAAPSGVTVGVDLNETNAVVAARSDGEVFFETGRHTRIKNKRDRQKVRRLQKKRAKKAGDTRSIRRVLKRLARRRQNRTKDFARCVAKRLVDWAGLGATIVVEKLRFGRRRRWRKGVNRRLSEWPHGLIRQSIRNRAERAGVAVVETNPAWTSQTCSSCGKLGERVRHSFSCKCGFAGHADVNAAKNILCGGGFARSPRAACQSAPKPRVTTSLPGKPPALAGGN